MKWPQEHDDMLRKLHALGLSSRQIAAELGLTFPGAAYSRSAVIGRKSRLGLCDKKITVKRATPPREPQATRTRRALVRGLETPGSPAWAPEIGAEAVDISGGNEDAASEARSVIDLGPDDCKWPSGGAPEPVVFCCRFNRLFGLPYCAAHTRRAGRHYAASEVAA